jgi:hypothetical protein
MPQTGAQRQSAYRARRAALIGELRSRVAILETGLADSARQLAEARADVERLSSAQCRHPAEAVDGGTCRACGADVW